MFMFYLLLLLAVSFQLPHLVSAEAFWVTLYNNNDEETTLNMDSDQAEGFVKYVGDKANKNTVRIAYDIPDGIFVSLLVDQEGSFAKDAPESEIKKIHKQKSFEVVGSGTRTKELMEKREMKNNIQAYYWKKYDTSFGYVDLYSKDNKEGIKKTLYLSLYPNNKIIDMSGWNIENSADSIRTNGLGDGVTVVFYQDDDGTGDTYDVMKNQNQNDLDSQNLGDKISSFKWSKAALTPSPTKAPVAPVPLAPSSYDHNPEWWADTIRDDTAQVDGTKWVSAFHKDVSVSPGRSQQNCLHWENDGGLLGGDASSQSAQPVQMKPCDDSSTNQEWILTDRVDSGSEHQNNYKFRNLKQWSIAEWITPDVDVEGLCLDTVDGTLEVDQTLTMKQCDEDDNTESQRWDFSGTGLLQNVDDNDFCIVESWTGEAIVKRCADSLDQVLKSAKNPCADATNATDMTEEVHNAYMELVEFMDAIEKEEINDQTILFDDFSLAKYEGRIDNYETKCGGESAQGTMVLLNYKLECTKSDEMLTVFVRDQPRCYSNFCLDGSDLSTDQLLFEEFAVEETQNRANDHISAGLSEDESSDWTCTGELFDDKAPGACEYQSGQIAESNTITDLSHLLTPKLENAKLFWIIPSPFPTMNQIVTLPNVAELKGPCEASGGVVAELPEQVRVVCTDPLNAEEEEASVFEVGGHLCLGSLCDYASGDADTAITKEVQARLMKADILAANVECTASDAFRMSSIGTAVGSIVLLWWYIF